MHLARITLYEASGEIDRSCLDETVYFRLFFKIVISLKKIWILYCKHHEMMVLSYLVSH